MRGKKCGNTRPVDGLGRVTLPKDLRDRFKIGTKDEVDISAVVDENGEEVLVLKKANPTCVFCHGSGDLWELSGKAICKKCCQKICAGELKPAGREEKPIGDEKRPA